MAVDLSRFVSTVKERIELEQLAGKRVAIDAYNTIYQFISIIRQPDGTPLVDSKNRVTSHLSGIFYRAISMMQYGITPIFVFDGTPPVLKARTLEARMNRREKAYEEWQKAKEEGMLAEARTYAMASSRISKEIIDSSKELLKHMGIVYMQAPSEGEAQAARLVSDGLAYAAASQDYDLFLFGAERVVRNLTITGKRKLPRKAVYIDVFPEFIYLSKLLDSLQITRRQLIMLGILLGTDFNDGIKGIGPVTALKIVKEHQTTSSIAEYISSKYGTGLPNINEIVEIFEKPETTSIEKDSIESALKEARPNKEAIIKFMCDEHGFSYERISKFADLLISIKNSAGQKGMGNWL